MSRPAAKHQRNRTTVCSTCGAPVGSACLRVEKNDTLDATIARGPHVSPHVSRLRAEAALREEQGLPSLRKRTREQILTESLSRALDMAATKADLS